MEYEKIIEIISKEEGLINRKFVNKKGEHCAVGCLLGKNLERFARSGQIFSCAPYVSLPREVINKFLDFGTRSELLWIQALNDECDAYGIKISKKDRRDIVIACMYVRKIAEENGEEVDEWLPGKTHSFATGSPEEFYWMKNFISSIVDENKAKENSRSNNQIRNKNK